MWCGHALLAGVELRPDLAAAVMDLATAVKIEPVPAEPPIFAPGSPAARPARPKQQVSSLLIAIAVIGIGSLMLVASAMRSPATPPTIAPAPPSAGPSVEAARVTSHRATVAPSETPRNPAAPRWIANGLARRGRTGPSGVTFELAANEDVPVWRSRVRPILSVRCVGKAVEVFVMTHSAASVENSGQHTVQVSFDNRVVTPQTWEHSIDHDALFSPDGSALARQISGARTMSFAYTPFNASTVFAQFSVAGLNAQLETSAKNCAWKP